MNPDTVTLFAAARRTRAFGLVLAGVIFAILGVGARARLSGTSSPRAAPSPSR